MYKRSIFIQIFVFFFTWTGFTETSLYDKMPMSLIDPCWWP